MLFPVVVSALFSSVLGKRWSVTGRASSPLETRVDVLFRTGGRKERKGKSIYIAPFIHYLYLEARRHGSHSFIC